ncbi:hypothetical protein SAMN02745126_00702 [Enhydrobacter aerosaccus]|uniref:Uncharacterized protein n=2 Tax=Enhydrobacter aerosaccus TaxID=225324 RepID=A0A1T4K4N2_9HYPH|nr:hypothetical protein SAMN02745126_00702 [Enhydrobacter aerosaccus]
MRRKLLNLSGVTKVERHQAVTAASEAISASGGWIIDHTLFSNIMATIRFALPVEEQEALKERLKAGGIGLEADASGDSKQQGTDRSLPSAEIVGSLTITFIHNDPDLLIEVPAIPG